MNTLENIGSDQRRIGQQDGAQRGDRREQDDAVAAIGHEHEEDQRSQDDQQTHRDQSPSSDRRAVTHALMRSR